MLTKSVEVTQEKYEEYLQEMRQDMRERKRTLTTQYTNLETRIGKLEEEYSEMLQGLSKLTDEKAVSQGNVVVSQKHDAIEELRLQKLTVLNEILDIERHTKTKRKELSYDVFSNYFKKLGDRVKNSTNQYEVDMIAKMAFSNCTVKNKKVLNHQWNQAFEKYVKSPFVTDCRGDTTRTCDLTHPMRVF